MGKIPIEGGLHRRSHNIPFSLELNLTSIEDFQTSLTTPPPTKSTVNNPVIDNYTVSIIGKTILVVVDPVSGIVSRSFLMP